MGGPTRVGKRRVEGSSMTASRRRGGAGRLGRAPFDRGRLERDEHSGQDSEAATTEPWRTSIFPPQRGPEPGQCPKPTTSCEARRGPFVDARRHTSPPRSPTRCLGRSPNNSAPNQDGNDERPEDNHRTTDSPTLWGTGLFLAFGCRLGVFRRNHDFGLRPKRTQ